MYRIDASCTNRTERFIGIMRTDPAPAWGRGIENQRRANLGDGTYRNPVMEGNYPNLTTLFRSE